MTNRRPRSLTNLLAWALLLSVPAQAVDGSLARCSEIPGRRVDGRSPRPVAPDERSRDGFGTPGPRGRSSADLRVPYQPSTVDRAKRRPSQLEPPRAAPFGSASAEATKPTYLKIFLPATPQNHRSPPA